MHDLVNRWHRWRRARRARVITPEQAAGRVRRGAAYLDDVEPRWYQRVDAGTLELNDGSCCVLGQLHGAFQLGLSRAQLFQPGSAPLSSRSPVDYGFLCVQGVSRLLQERDYTYLNRAWQTEIALRQGQHQGPGADPARSERRLQQATAQTP